MKKIIILSLIISLAAACDLDKFPADKIEKSQSLQTVEDAKQFNNAMYVHLRNRLYGIYMFSEDIQADLYNASIDFGNRNGSVYRWSFVSSDYTFRDTWRYYYAAIANINNFIDNIDNVNASTENDANTLKVYKGEAHLLRAFYYFQLTKKFCKDYDPSTAANTMGLPLVTKFNVNEKPSRSSLEATYTLITDDIKEAKTLLTTEGKLGASQLTKDCITALEARIYLAMHRYADAAGAADALITGGKYPLINTKDMLKEMWHSDKTHETIFQLIASKPNELPVTDPNAVNSIFLGYSSATGKYSPDFIPQQWIVDLYDNADIRREVYLEKKLINIVATDYTDIYAFNKYPGNPDLFTTNNTNYQHMPKVFRIAEMHLIKAEGLYMANDEPGALAALNVLRTNRGLTALTGLSGAALMAEIKNERVRELIGEGTRLDDLKRWGDDCIRKAPQELAVVTKGEDDNELVKRAGEDKFVWAIPDNDIRSNPNLKDQQNPGY